SLSLCFNPLEYFNNFTVNREFIKSEVNNYYILTYEVSTDKNKRILKLKMALKGNNLIDNVPMTDIMVSKTSHFQTCFTFFSILGDELWYHRYNFTIKSLKFSSIMMQITGENNFHLIVHSQRTPPHLFGNLNLKISKYFGA